MVNSDTLTCITMPQLHRLNLMLVERMECHEIRDTLYKQVELYGRMTSDYQQQVAAYTQSIGALKQIIFEERKLKEGLQEEVKALEHKSRKQHNIIRYGGAGAGILLLLAIIF